MLLTAYLETLHSEDITKLVVAWLYIDNCSMGGPFSLIRYILDCALLVPSDSRHAKDVFLLYANSKGTEQPEHL